MWGFFALDPVCVVGTPTGHGELEIPVWNDVYFQLVQNRDSLLFSKCRRVGVSFKRGSTCRGSNQGAFCDDKWEVGAGLTEPMGGQRAN